MEKIQLPRPNNLTEYHFETLARNLKDPDFSNSYPLYRLLFGPASVEKIFLRLIYWLPKSKRADNAVYKSARELACETGYSTRTVERASRALQKMGFTTVVRKANGTPTNHYTFDLEKFLQYVADKLKLDVEQVRVWMGNPVMTKYSGKSDVPASEGAQNGGVSSAQESEMTPNKSRTEFRPDVGVDSDKTADSVTISKQTRKTDNTEHSNETPTTPYVTSFERFMGRPPEDDDVVVVNPSSLKMEIHSLSSMLKISHAIIERWVTQYGLIRVKDVAHRAVEDPKVRNPGGWAKLALEKNFQWADKVPTSTNKSYTSGPYAAFIRS